MDVANYYAVDNKKKMSEARRSPVKSIWTESRQFRRKQHHQEALQKAKKLLTLIDKKTQNSELVADSASLRAEFNSVSEKLSQCKSSEKVTIHDKASCESSLKNLTTRINNNAIKFFESRSDPIRNCLQKWIASGDKYHSKPMTEWCRYASFNLLFENLENIIERMEQSLNESIYTEQTKEQIKEKKEELDRLRDEFKATAIRRIQETLQTMKAASEILEPTSGQNILRREQRQIFENLDDVESTSATANDLIDRAEHLIGILPFVGTDEAVKTELEKTKQELANRLRQYIQEKGGEGGQDVPFLSEGEEEPEEFPDLQTVEEFRGYSSEESELYEEEPFQVNIPLEEERLEMVPSGMSESIRLNYEKTFTTDADTKSFDELRRAFGTNILPPRRSPDSLAVLMLGKSCFKKGEAVKGCFGRQDKQCTPATVKEGKCDMRRIKVPSDINTVGDNKYALYNALDLGARIKLQLQRSLVRFGSAISHILPYSKFVVDRYFREIKSQQIPDDNVKKAMTICIPPSVSRASLDRNNLQTFHDIKLLADNDGNVNIFNERHDLTDPQKKVFTLVNTFYGDYTGKCEEATCPQKDGKFVAVPIFHFDQNQNIVTTSFQHRRYQDDPGKMVRKGLGMYLRAMQHFYMAIALYIMAVETYDSVLRHSGDQRRDIITEFFDAATKKVIGAFANLPDIDKEPLEIFSLFVDSWKADNEYARLLWRGEEGEGPILPQPDQQILYSEDPKLVIYRTALTEILIYYYIGYAYLQPRARKVLAAKAILESEETKIQKITTAERFVATIFPVINKHYKLISLRLSED